MKKYNYNFGKLENDVFFYAPNKLPITIEAGGKTYKCYIYNASADAYKEQGYLPFLADEMPPQSDEGYYEPYYIQEDETIYKKWRFVPYEGGEINV